MNNNFLPMTTAELMDRAIDVYKKSFGRQLGFAAIWALISFMASFIITILAGIVIGIVTVFAASLLSPFSDTFTYTTGIVFLVFALALPIALLWLSVSSAGHILISKSAFYSRKENLPVGQLPRIAIRIFGALIAQALASLPFLLVLFIGLASGFFAFLLHNAIWLLVLLALIWAVAFFTFFNIFSLAIAVATFERKTFFDALIRSKQLIHGEFWKIAGMRLIWFISVAAIGTTFYGAFALVGAGVGFASTFLDTNINYAVIGGITLISTLASFAIMFVMMPLDGVFLATLYFNQRIKKEGLDIEIRLEELAHE